jgi:hypothetical protein
MMNRTDNRTRKRTHLETHPPDTRQSIQSPANLAAKKRRLWVWVYAPWIP